MGTRVISLGGNSVIKTYEGELSALEEDQMWKRAERNAKLAETDVYMIEDFPTTKKTEWKAYRKALRDMDFSDPDNINWPDKPE